MGSGFAKKKKEAKLLQQKFEEMQAKMKDERVTGTAGNGLVSITLNGEHEMLEAKIKPECVDPDDIEGLEDLIRAAYNDAAKQLEKSSQELGGGFPGMGGFGF
ncbi:MAG: Nucleoid-associated protein YbaB [Chlamydiales bacterium]|nr:Nucleoid-associated protein YbaB [Chlamydiales bacterium]